MGPEGDHMAVLDAALRVRGIDNLRVADMSACPNINSGNTAAPAMMLGDRCARFILGEEADGNAFRDRPASREAALPG
jgi:choline dehydrogenase-like flavoprotein